MMKKNFNRTWQIMAFVILSSTTMVQAQITGSGTTNYIPKMTGTSSIGNSIISQDGSDIEINSTDATIKIKNSNDVPGGFIGNTYTSLQIGMYSASASGVISAGQKRSFLGMDNNGNVGSLTNSFGSPSFRNLLDDGSGNMKAFGNMRTGGKLFLKTDDNHGIGYYSGFASSSGIDGPVVFGYSGGALGSAHGDSPYSVALRWWANGGVAIGSNTNPVTDGYLFAVKGKIRATEVKIYTTWADFVFKPEYQLPTIESVDGFIKENQHLPGVPSEKEIIDEGVEIGEMQKIQMQKIEELTLYIIELNEKLKMLETKNSELMELIKQ